MKRILVIITVIGLAACRSSKITVVNQSEKTSLDQTLFYALPRNTLEFEVKMKQTTLIRGSDFDQTITEACVPVLAKKFNIEEGDLKALKNADKISQAVLEKDGLIVTAGAKPDISKIYAVNISPKFYQDNITGLTFTQDWLLTEATLSSENKAFEIGLSTVSSLLGTIGLFTKGRTDIPETTVDECSKKYAALDLAIQTMEDFIKAAAGSAINAEAFNATKAHYQKKIEEAFAKAFYEKKEKIVSIKFSLDLPNNFVLTSVKKLFRIDASGKLIINNEFNNNIRRYSPDKEDFAAVGGETDWYTIEATRAEDDVYSAISSKLSTPSGETGLVYNVPAFIDVKIVQPKTNAVLLLTPFRMAQFGKLGWLNKKLNKVTVTLDPLTGSLTKVSGESKSVATSNISGTADVITKANDTFKKPTETEELEKKAKILELKAKIKGLEAADQ